MSDKPELTPEFLTSVRMKLLAKGEELMTIALQVEALCGRARDAEADAAALRAENKRLVEALEKIAELTDVTVSLNRNMQVHTIARAALEAR